MPPPLIMPATEQTWRDLKLMHLVFGVSALAMLITTIWMLAADHNREWKKIQNATQRIDDWNIAAKIAEDKTQRFEQERARLEKQLQEQQLQPPSEELIDSFLASALYDKYLASKGGRIAADDPLAKDYAALASLTPSELARPENRALLTSLLDALKKQVRDDTGIREAYEQVVSATQAARPSVSTPSRTPRLKGQRNPLSNRRSQTHLKLRPPPRSRKNKLRSWKRSWRLAKTW